MNFAKFIAAVTAVLIMIACLPERAAYAAAETSEKAVGSAIPERYLEGNELELYRLVLENIIAVSEGRQTAETFYLSVSNPFADDKEYENAIKKVMFFIDNYTSEYSFWTYGKGSLVYDTRKCGIIYSVSPAYQEKGNKNKISSGRLYDVKRALANAKAIADKYEGKSDYEKAIGFAKEICALNTYNKEAEQAADDYSQKNIDPWNIIYVFDRDPSTNVVCAGYAKSFQYLCSLGGIECHYVTGDIAEGYHAWNIVVIDGKNYFVDLTVCDQYSENVIARDHPFVLNSVVSSTAKGFNTYFSQSGFIKHTHAYTYSDNALEYLPESLRILSTRAYSKGGGGTAFIIMALVAVGGAAFFIIKRRKKAEDEYY